MENLEVTSEEFNVEKMSLRCKGSCSGSCSCPKGHCKCKTAGDYDERLDHNNEELPSQEYFM